MGIYLLPYNRPSGDLVFAFVENPDDCNPRFWGGRRGWVSNLHDAQKYTGAHNADRAAKRHGFNRKQRRIVQPEVQL